MGSANRSDAVVGGSGEVHGTDGLFFIDASIMPTVPAANTHIPTLMCKARDLI